MFNAIDRRSAPKIDFWMLRRVPFEENIFARRLRLTLFGEPAWIAAARTRSCTSCTGTPSRHPKGSSATRQASLREHGPELSVFAKAREMMGRASELTSSSAPSGVPTFDETAN